MQSVHFLQSRRVRSEANVRSSKKTDFGSILKNKICTFEKKVSFLSRCFCFPTKKVFKPKLSDLNIT